MARKIEVKLDTFIVIQTITLAAAIIFGNEKLRNKSMYHPKLLSLFFVVMFLASAIALIYASESKIMAPIENGDLNYTQSVIGFTGILIIFFLHPVLIKNGELSDRFFQASLGVYIPFYFLILFLHLP